MLFLLATSLSVQADYHFAPCGITQATTTSLQRIENEWPMRGSGDKVSQYVQKLGLKLAHLRVQGQNVPWQFSVVRNLAPNAFSIGGGYIFITDGAVNFVQNESELAAILAHELGHELAGHFCEAADSSGMFDVFFTPDAPQHQAGVGSMTQVIDPIKEQQADHIALSLLQAGGYNPRAMLDLARRMPSGGAVHLMDINRIRSLEYTLSTMPAITAGNSYDFQEVKRILAAE